MSSHLRVMRAFQPSCFRYLKVSFSSFSQRILKLDLNKSSRDPALSANFSTYLHGKMFGMTAVLALEAQRATHFVRRQDHFGIATGPKREKMHTKFKARSTSCM